MFITFEGIGDHGAKKYWK